MDNEKSALLYVGKQLFQKIQNQVTLDFNVLSHQKQISETLVILNYELDVRLFQYFLQKSCMVVLADGGANRIYQTKFRNSSKIKAIVGDLDSIKQQVLSYYKEEGKVEIQKIQDQDSCDMSKCLQYIKKAGRNKVICFGSFGGRMDHTLHHISLAQKYCDQNQTSEIILSGFQSLMYFLRPKTSYKIVISQIISKQGCGIMTFEKQCKVQTKGFKWNMGPDYTFNQIGWGKFQSTSNAILESHVQMKISSRAIFICSLIIS